mgnify:CR=1 FL=1
MGTHSTITELRWTIVDIHDKVTQLLSRLSLLEEEIKNEASTPENGVCQGDGPTRDV